MRKIYAIIFAAICSICLCTISAAALDYDDTVYSVEVDGNNDGTTDYFVDLQLNTTDKTCAITDLFGVDTEKLIIPPIIKGVEYFDYGSYSYKTADFTLTEIQNVDNYYQEDLTLIELPYTLSYIAPKSVGYYYDFFYDSSTGYYTYGLVKNSDVVMKYTQYTTAATYVINNGFKKSAYNYLNITKADVTYTKTGYTYSGSAIKAKNLVVKYDGKTLTQGVDYNVIYSNNVNAGSAKMLIYGIGKYRGKVAYRYTISPKTITSAVFSSIADKTYTGSAIMAYPTITVNGKTLKNNVDYTLKGTNNTAPGTATITAAFKGNYSGTAKTTFKIKLGAISGLKASSSNTTYITLSWNKVACSRYEIYRYNSSTGSYSLIASTANNYYKNTGLTQGTVYKYKVVAVYGYSTRGTAAYLETGTKLSTPKMTLANKGTSAVISWNKNSKATGYEIYRMSSTSSSYSKVKTITSASTLKYTNTGLSSSGTYYYKVRSYLTKNGKTYYSAFSNIDNTQSAYARLSGATLTSKTSYKCYNRQSASKTTTTTYTLSTADINTLKKFANAHFTSSMTAPEKVEYTLNWINKNVKYASSSSDWNKISNKTFVDAIFNYKLGQCAQYNGALVGMMAYLGYDVNLVQGWRGTNTTTNYWQHFWGEVTICGVTYVMETGNYGQNGDWKFLCAKYSETNPWGRSGYIMNGKVY